MYRRKYCNFYSMLFGLMICLVVLLIFVGHFVTSVWTRLSRIKIENCVSTEDQSKTTSQTFLREHVTISRNLSFHPAIEKPHPKLNSHPYLPWTVLKVKAAKGNKSEIQRWLRNGGDLHRVQSLGGETTFWENGVVYNQFPYLESRNDLWYSSEYEPYVPFEEKDFFLQDKNKIAAFHEIRKTKQKTGTWKERVEGLTDREIKTVEEKDVESMKIRDLSEGIQDKLNDSKGQEQGRNGVTGFNHTERVQKEVYFAGNDHGVRKLILWLTDKDYIKPINGLRPLRMCPEFPCLMTSNPKYMELSAAMLVQSPRIRGPPPTSRSPNQVMVYYQMEPNVNLKTAFPAQWTRNWKSVFNWTMSYRWDADIPVFHGIIRRRPNPRRRNRAYYAAILAKKSRQVAWFVSNVTGSSERYAYVEELRKNNITVDISLDNKDLWCPRHMDWECMKTVGKNYKFYLAFENSFCDNYITQKFFKYYNLDVIIIARGINEYDKIAPTGTFINAADFSSPKELASRIRYLDENNKDYIQLLKEKDKYFSLYEDYAVRLDQELLLENRYEAVSFCHMCHRLWNMDKYNQSIRDINDWFRQSHCYEA